MLRCPYYYCAALRLPAARCPLPVCSGLLCEHDGTHASAFVQLGMDMHLACNFRTNLTDDTKVRVQAKLGLFDTMVSFGLVTI